MVLLFFLSFYRLCSSQSGFCRAPFQFECFYFRAFSLAFFCLAIVVSVLSSIS